MLKPNSFKAVDRGPWIMTNAGIRFHMFDPQPEEILLQDIAHSLSQMCRFVGHTTKFYSVAEHSIRVADLCSKENKLWGLLHDAAEAYIGDISGPFKSRLPEVKAVEKNIMRVIANKFGLSAEMPAEVKDADLVMLVTEGHQLMPRSELWIGEYTQEPLKNTIRPLTQDQAKQAFLDEATKLMRFNHVV